MLILYVCGLLLTFIAAIGVSDLVASIQLALWLGQLARTRWVGILGNLHLPVENGRQEETPYSNITIGDCRIVIYGKADAATLALLVQILADMASKQGDVISQLHRPVAREIPKAIPSLA